MSKMDKRNEIHPVYLDTDKTKTQTNSHTAEEMSLDENGIKNIKQSQANIQPQGKLTDSIIQIAELKKVENKARTNRSPRK